MTESQKNSRARKLADEEKYGLAATLFQELALKSSSHRDRGPSHKITLSFRDHAATCLGAAGDFAAAIEEDEETLVLRRQKAKWRPDAAICTTLYRLAMNYREQGSFMKAVNANKEAKEIREQLPDSQEAPDLLDIQYDLAYNLSKLQKFDQAAALNRKTLSAMEKSKGIKKKRLINCREALGSDLYSLGGKANCQEAVQLFELNLNVSRAEYGEDGSETLTQKEWLDVCTSRLNDILKVEEKTLKAVSLPVSKKVSPEISKVASPEVSEVDPKKTSKAKGMLKPEAHSSRENRKRSSSAQPKADTLDLPSSTEGRVRSLSTSPMVDAASIAADVLPILNDTQGRKAKENSKSVDADAGTSSNVVTFTDAKVRPYSKGDRGRKPERERNAKANENNDILEIKQSSEPTIRTVAVPEEIHHANIPRKRQDDGAKDSSSMEPNPVDEVLTNLGKIEKDDTTLALPGHHTSKHSKQKHHTAEVLNPQKGSNLVSTKADGDEHVIPGEWPHLELQITKVESEVTSTGDSKKLKVPVTPLGQASDSNNIIPVLELPLNKRATSIDATQQESTDSQKVDSLGSPSGMTKPSRSLSAPPLEPSGKRKERSVSLFDNSLAGDEEDMTGAREATIWFGLLKENTHQLIKQQAIQPDAGIRIAILDTGVDGTHPDFEKARRRIRGYRSWVSPKFECGDRKDGIGVSTQTLKNNFKDDNGHGTHAAACILAVDPWAQLFVARVAKNGKDGIEIDSEHVIQAITHATDTWKVDIITMSFGWSIPPQAFQKIESAINIALDQRILVFAAASNTGANATGPAFPASLERVFCINSANGLGKRSDFNPTDPQGYNIFTTLGEGVKSAWPAHLDQGLYRHDSGTSIATPVAAASAALVLRFAKQQLPGNGWETALQHLKTFPGMRDMFFLMANERDDKGFRYVRLWNLLNASHGTHSTSFATSSIMNWLRTHYFFED